MAAITGILLRHRPKVPALSRWTTIGPALNFYLVGNIIHRIFLQLFLCVFSDEELSFMQAQIESLRERLSWCQLLRCAAMSVSPFLVLAVGGGSDPGSAAIDSVPCGSRDA